MKKRVISFVMAICVLCGLLAACGEEPVVKEKTTAEVISEALEKTEALDNISAKMDIEVNMSAEGISMSIPMKIDLKAKNMKSDDPLVYAKIGMSMLGQSIDMEMYQEGQWAYMVMGDMKYKAKTDEATGITDNAGNMLKDLPDTLLENVTFVKNEDGSQTATIAVPDDQFAGIYEDFIKGLNTGTEVDISKVKIMDAVVKITVANGYVTVYDMSFKMDMTAEGVEAAAEVKANITYDNPGGVVEITPPQGYKDFEEQGIDE